MQDMAITEPIRVRMDDGREAARALDSVRFFTCRECGRVFDMRSRVDQDEWAWGHDCEA